MEAKIPVGKAVLLASLLLQLFFNSLMVDFSVFLEHLTSAIHKWNEATTLDKLTGCISLKEWFPLTYFTFF